VSVPVTPDQIRTQLERILASPGFASADRASRFLRYVVERTLNIEGGEGDQHNLKEYVIGREVFDRGEDYDPRVDSIVRVEAGRLRSKVDEYYAGPGRADQVVIQLRRGSYTPAFEERRPEPEERVASAPSSSSFSRWRLGAGLIAAGLVVLAVLAWRGGNAYVGRPELRGGDQPPTEAIAVLPFASYSTNEAAQLLAARVTDGITSELARLGTLGVVSHTSAQQFAGVRQPLREIAQALNAQIILEGNVREEAGRIIIQVRLVDASVDRKFWVKDFDGQASDIPEIQRQIAKSAAAAALQRKR
jgi:TolB-like protein